MRQREQAGMYDVRRLDDALYHSRFLSWAHPAKALRVDKPINKE
ncbi:MAG: hypothetical protein COA42_20715 [Alteromonadaceae bacterium]|nr:MAG: hypothetical protein COA42_20715 [Alteromonadaceae bacterium]